MPVETKRIAASQWKGATNQAGLGPARVSAKTAHLKETAAVRVPLASQQQSKELLQWNVRASFPGSLATGPFAVLPRDPLNSCQSYELVAET